MVVGVSAFGQLQFAQNNRTCFAQFANHRAVFCGNVVGVDGHASGRLGARRPTQVFHRDGHTMQRPQDVTSANGFVSRLGVCQCVVGHDGGVALQVGVKLRNASQLRLGGLDRGNLARLDALGNFKQLGVMCFSLTHGNPLLVSPIVIESDRICPPKNFPIQGNSRGFVRPSLSSRGA